MGLSENVSDVGVTTHLQNRDHPLWMKCDLVLGTRNGLPFLPQRKEHRSRWWGTGTIL